MPALTAELGHFVSALTLKDIPLEAQAVAKTGFTDCFGVMVAGNVLRQARPRRGWSIT